MRLQALAVGILLALQPALPVWAAERSIPSGSTGGGFSGGSGGSGIASSRPQALPGGRGEKAAFGLRLSVREIYTDNLGLNDQKKIDDWVTSITPGLTWNLESRFASLTFDAEAEGLYFQKAELAGMDHSHIKKRMNARARMNVLPQWLTVDAGANSGDTFASARDSYGLEPLSPVGNTTRFESRNAGATFAHDFSGLWEFSLQHQISRNSYDRALQTEFGVVGDTDTRNSNLSLKSGEQLTSFLWSLSAQEHDLSGANALSTVTPNQDDRNSRRRNARAELGWKMLPSLYLLARGGREDNSYASDVLNSPYINGDYSGAGFGWTPTKGFTLTALSGSDYKESQLKWEIGQRFSVDLDWREMTVGLFSGPQWNASISHYNRNWRTSIRRSEGITNFQQLLLERREIAQRKDDQGKPLFDSTGRPVLDVRDIFSLTDGEFRREREDITLERTGRRSSFGCSAFEELRQSVLVTTRGEDMQGGACQMRFTLQARSALSLSLRKDRRTFFSDSQLDHTRSAQLAWQITLSPRTGLVFDVQRFERESPVALRNYTENRFQAELGMRF